jgi:hypothetical protein
LGWRLTVGLILVVAGLATPAQAQERSAPTGRSPALTRFEAEASSVARSLAGRSVEISCVSAATWRGLAARWGFDPAATWALTPRHWDSDAGGAAADGFAQFSPRTCGLGSRFSARPTEQGARICRHGTRQGECDDWADKLRSVHVLTHESMHLAGVMGEAEADCLATQVDAFVARALGADRRFARRLAREYWTYYYPTQPPAYRSRECRDGGALDLFPAQRGWPSPAWYPRDLAGRIAAFNVPAARVAR